MANVDSFAIAKIQVDSELVTQSLKYFKVLMCEKSWKGALKRGFCLSVFRKTLTV